MSPKIRREILLLSLPVVLMSTAVFYFQSLNLTPAYLIGTWRSSNSSNKTLTTFKANSEFEMVIKFSTTGDLGNADGTGVGIPLVFKGRYSATKTRIRLFDVRRYSRVAGKDTLFIPGNCGINCVVDSEIAQADEEWSQRPYTLIFANWRTGVIKVRSPDSGQYKGVLETWTRQP